MRCDGSARPASSRTRSCLNVSRASRKTRPSRVQEVVLIASKAVPGSATQGGREQLVRPLVRLHRELALVEPLIDDVLPIRLADAVGRTPGVLVPHGHLAPCLAERGRGVLRGVAQREQRFSLLQAVGGTAHQRFFFGARYRAVFPVRRHVARVRRQPGAMPPFELREEAARRVDDESRRVERLVPGLHELGQLRIHWPVVTSNRVADLHHVVGVPVRGELAEVVEHRGTAAGRLELAQVHAVEPGVPSPCHPEQEALVAGRRLPPERPVAECLERAADSVAAVRVARHVVRPAAEIADAAERERADDGPAETGNVRVHRRWHLPEAVLGAQPPGAVRPSNQLVGSGNPREDVRVVALEIDRAVLHRGDQRLLLGLARLAQVALNRPQALDVPLEARVEWQVARLRRQLDRVAEVLPLLPLHLWLRVRVSDVHVRVRQQVDLPRPDRREHDALRQRDPSLDLDDDGQVRAGRADGQHDAEVAGRRGALPERFTRRPHGHRRGVARPSHLDADDAGPVLEARFLGGRPRPGADRLLEGHVVIGIAGRLADNGEARRPGRHQRARHRRHHEAEQLVEGADAGGLE